MGRILGITAVLLALGVTHALGNPPQSGGTLIYGRGMDSVGLDPAHESDGESFKVCDNLFETLVRFAGSGTEIEPALAESWTVSEDGLRWEFQIRQGVRFHCGRRFDARAVLYSLERQWSARQPLHSDHGLGGPYPFWGYLGIDEILETIDSPAPGVVRFVLKEPSAPFLSNLACNFAAMVCSEDAHAAGEDFFRHPCGTGPFRFESWDRAETVVLRRNEEYWDHPPYLDRVVFRCLPENSTRFFELLAGSLHMMDGVPPDDVPAIRSNRALKLLGEPGMNVAYLAMNMDHSPFGDVRVRRAVNHAVDRAAIVRGLYGHLAVVADGPVPPNVFAAHPDPPSYEYAPERARELLVEAGYPDGFETTLWVMSGPRPYMPQPPRIAQAIQANLAGIGIRAKIVTFEWGTYLDRVHRGHHDMALLGWQADNGDPDNFLFTHFDPSAAVAPAGNIAFYRSEEAHEHLLAGRRTVRPEDRVGHYHRAQELIHADAPWVPLVHTMELAAMRCEVMGYSLHPTGRVLLSRVWLSR